MRPACAAICLLAFVPSAYAGRIHATYDQVDAAMNDATACIRYEAAAIAPEPVDLDDATLTVIANCTPELQTERAATLSRYGRDRDPYEPPGRELLILREDEARDAGVAVRNYFRVHRRWPRSRTF